MAVLLGVRARPGPRSRRGRRRRSSWAGRAVLDGKHEVDAGGAAGGGALGREDVEGGAEGGRARLEDGEGGGEGGGARLGDGEGGEGGGEGTANTRGSG